MGRGLFPYPKLFFRVSKSGFSLVELLVVIAVLAIIAAIAIPNFASIAHSSRYAKNQRNAQNIASAYNSARAAGWNENQSSTEDAVAAVVQGIVGNGTNGLPVGISFGVQNLSATEQNDTLSFLNLVGNGSNQVLIYNGMNH